MRVLITGAAGFIGSHVAGALMARGDEVVGYDNFDPFYDVALKRENVAALEAAGPFRSIEGDIRDEDRVRATFRAEDPDAIIHLAARAGVRPSLAEPMLYQDVNVRGTNVLLEATKERGGRPFLFASSSSVYGANEKVPFAEDDRVDHPVSPYAATKKAGELIAHTYHHLFGFPITCLRFFTVYGPRQRPEMAIHRFTRRIAEGRDVPLFGDGSSERDYTYVDDIVDGVLRSLDRASGYRIYNLGGSRTTRLADLVAMIGRALGVEPKIDWQPNQPGDVPRTWADVTRSEAELGYRPHTPIEEGIERFVAWYRARGA